MFVVIWGILSHFTSSRIRLKSSIQQTVRGHWNWKGANRLSYFAQMASSRPEESLTEILWHSSVHTRIFSPWMADHFVSMNSHVEKIHISLSVDVNRVVMEDALTTRHFSILDLKWTPKGLLWCSLFASIRSMSKLITQNIDWHRQIFHRSKDSIDRNSFKAIIFPGRILMIFTRASTNVNFSRRCYNLTSWLRSWWRRRGTFSCLEVSRWQSY